jgi:hypothetical protein
MNRALLFRRSLVVAASLRVLAIAGCELVVDFDRSKIDAGSIDAAVADVTIDQTTPGDGAAEAAPDGAPDAAPDSEADGAPDVATDSPADAPDDVAADAPDDADDSG